MATDVALNAMALFVRNLVEWGQDGVAVIKDCPSHHTTKGIALFGEFWPSRGGTSVQAFISSGYILLSRHEVIDSRLNTSQVSLLGE